jgi:hypothetical protein
MTCVVIAKGGTVFANVSETMRKEKMQKMLDRVGAERIHADDR